MFLDDLPICVEKDRCIDMPEFFLWTLKLAETVEQVCPHAALSVCTVPSPAFRTLYPARAQCKRTSYAAERDWCLLVLVQVLPALA